METATATGFDAAMIATVLNCIFSCITLIVTGLSVRYAYRAYLHQKDRSKKDAACELARYYSENIIDRYFFANHVFSVSGAAQKIKEMFPYENLKDFTYKELCTILGAQGIALDEASKHCTSIDAQVIYQAKIFLAKDTAERDLIAKGHIKVKSEEDGSGVERFELVNTDILLHELQVEVNSLLNDLEWFSMSCQYGLADEEMLYQSLHQTFLSHVWLMYFFIASNNKTNEEKVYTNVIWLFNHWKDRLFALQSSVNDKASKMQEDYNSAKAALEKLGEQMDSVEAPVYTGGPLK